MHKRDKKRRVSRKGYRARWARAVEMKAEGHTAREVAAELGITPAAVYYIWNKHDPEPYEKVCALPECDVVFKTKMSLQLYCCHTHSKRGVERNRKGREARYMPCRLAECDEEVFCPAIRQPKTRRFCSRAHASKFSDRGLRTFYEKLVEKTACVVCGWWGPGIDQHHIVHQADGGGDDDANLMWLCSNHHRLLHSGLATFDGETYTDCRDYVRECELEKREAWGE
jgi:hypothetical protein